MNENPLAGHPLLQKPKDDIGPVVGVDFSDIEVRAVSARNVGKSTPTLITEASRQLGKQALTAALVRAAVEGATPLGMNRGGDTFPKGTRFEGDPKQAPPIRVAEKVAVVGAPDTTAENLAAAQAAIQEAQKKVRFIVPHDLPQSEFDRISAQIAKETKLPFEVVRAAMPAVAKEAPLMLRTHQEVMQERRAQEGSRFAAQIQRALDIIKAAKRPVKMGFIEHELGTSIFRALEPELNGHPCVQAKRHKNQLYYTWKG